MNCRQCGRDNPATAKFCAECGARLVVVCAACATELLPHAKFCSECGEPVTRVVPVATAGLAGPTSIPGPGRADASTVANASARFGAPSEYLPRRLAERILASRVALEGERKQVTVLFADIKG